MSARAVERAAVAALMLLLGACAAQGTRPNAPVSNESKVAPEVAQTAIPTTPAAPVDAAPSPPVAADEPLAFWPRLSRRLAMPQCDDSPLALRWAKIYTAGKVQFAANVKRAMPFLMLVDDEVERRGLPGEYVLLPYLESGYEPIPSQGDRPAGMWQLMPDTARLKNLRIGRDYDGRLDAQASTIAALDLLDDYQHEFGDWRLADMAFNAGEYRVKKLLGVRELPLDTNAIGKLSLSPITHEHLAKLRGLACVVADPARFGVTLPEPDAGDRLVEVPLDGPIDLRVAARLASLDLASVRRFNAGHRTSHMADTAPHRLLLPASKAETFASAATSIPTELRRDWREIALTQPASLGTIAQERKLPASALAAANGRSADVGLPIGTRILVPGVEPIVAERAAATASQTHVVRSGETLSGIAKEYGVRVAELLRWNALQPRARLHPGDRLRIGAGGAD